MGGCCGGGDPRTVRVEFEYLVVDGDTCDRCGDTRQSVRAAVDDAAGPLSRAGVTLEFAERHLGADRLEDSNRVLVNGRAAESWLGGTEVMTECASCSDLVGADVCCREIEIGGVRTAAIDRDVIFDAIMAAAGLGTEGVPGSACGGDSAAPSSTTAGDVPVRVTLVTGPGCG